MLKAGAEKTDGSDEVRGTTHQVFFAGMLKENAKVPVGPLLKEPPLPPEHSNQTRRAIFNDRAPLWRV